MATQLTKQEIQTIIRAKGGDREHLLSILIELQNASGASYISEETANVVAQAMKLTPTHLYDIITFYAMLADQPRGTYVLEICNSTPCYYSKSTQLAALVTAELGVDMGKTTADGLFTPIYVPCVGACEIGPVIKIRDKIYGNLTPEKVTALIAAYRTGNAAEGGDAQ